MRVLRIARLCMFAWDFKRCHWCLSNYFACFCSKSILTCRKMDLNSLSRSVFRRETGIQTTICKECVYNMCLTSYILNLSSDCGSSKSVQLAPRGKETQQNCYHRTRCYHFHTLNCNADNYSYALSMFGHIDRKGRIKIIAAATIRAEVITVVTNWQANVQLKTRMSVKNLSKAERKRLTETTQKKRDHRDIT